MVKPFPTRMPKKYKCPKCGAAINPGSLMGQASSEAKTEAARRNASKPPGKGKQPRGRPRKKQ